MAQLPAELVKILHIVPEEDVLRAAEWVGEGDNSFRKLIRDADAFKKEGCTPLYLATEDHSAFCVSSEETYAKKLH